MRRAEAAAAASVLLVVAAVVYLAVAPIYQTDVVSCSSGGRCVSSSATAPLGWNTVMLVPLLATGLVLAGTVLHRWTRLSLPLTGLGCLGLVVITFLGVFSIGVFVLPADVAALAALLYMRRRGTSS